MVTSVFVGYLKLRDFFDVAEVVVPNVLGMSEEKAREVIENEGLNFEVEGTAKNSEFQPGEVIRQNPEEKSKVKKRIHH